MARSLIKSLRSKFASYDKPVAQDSKTTEQRSTIVPTATSRRRKTPAASITTLPGGLPTACVPPDTDALAVAQMALDMLKSLRSEHLLQDALWRDLFSLTGTARTFFSNETIAATWQRRSKVHSPINFRLVPGSATVVRPGPPGISWVQTGYTLCTTSTPSITVKGIIRVVPDALQTHEWKIWLIVSTLDQIQGLPNPDIMSPRIQPGSFPPGSVGESPIGSPTNARIDSDHDDDLNSVSSRSSSECDYDCVIVGGGHAGLSLAGYLQALGTRYVVLDMHDRIGGMWSQRYDSVNIHTSRGYGQFPFGSIWGSDTPYHLKKKHLETGYNEYVKRHDINLMLSTTVERTWFDNTSQSWMLMIRTHGNVIYMRAKHLVMALGAGGQIPRYPEAENKNAFKGTMIHSVDYQNASAWKGKRAVVVGSANTAHDVSNDMLEAGCSSVTMVQRGRTPVLPVECWSGVYDKLYNDNVPIAQSDVQTMSLPIALQRAMSMMAIKNYSDTHPEMFDGLQKAGFKVDRYMDLYHCLYERFGGHYVDVGVSKKIVDGLIKVKNDSVLKGFDEQGLLFENGSRLDADVVVFATGFEGNMRDSAETIVGKEVGDQLDDWWGVDSEGEIRGAWKPMGHPNIWFTGGNIAIARFFARYLALQIKAEIQGTPLQRYTDTS